jgi:hypothetical protein
VIEYIFAEVDNSELESIQKFLGFMCKENNISQKRQGYKILFKEEMLFPKDNDVLFTSGSKKYLSFYGKIYLSNNGKILETIHQDDQKTILEPSVNSLLIISGGVRNSTIVDSEESVKHFYIAPSHLLGLQDPEKWQDI